MEEKRAKSTVLAIYFMGFEIRHFSAGGRQAARQSFLERPRQEEAAYLSRPCKPGHQSHDGFCKKCSSQKKNMYIFVKAVRLMICLRESPHRWLFLFYTNRSNCLVYIRSTYLYLNTYQHMFIV